MRAGDAPEQKRLGKRTAAVHADREPPLRTYSHLCAERRIPTEYEVVTTRLHYYAHGGFEVDVPMKRWYEQYQRGSPLQCSDWERFRDPRQTTYASYVLLQHKREVFVDGILQAIEVRGYDKMLSDEWRGILERTVAPGRYLCHGLQMLAAYVAQMAPSGRICVAALFQAADELRRTQRLAYRMRQLQIHYPGFGEDSRQTWERDPLWQPAREAIERLLVTYDFGEALIALNLSLKPVIDELLMVKFAELGSEANDPLLREIFASLYEDCLWQRAWTAELVKLVWSEAPDNRAVIQGWLDKWYPPVRRAAHAFRPIFGLSFDRIAHELDDAYAAYLRPLDLEPPNGGSFA